MWANQVDYVNRPEQFLDLQAGLTASTMMSLADLAISAPDQIIFKPFSDSYIRGDLTRVGDGASSIEWIWDVMAQVELATLNNIFFSTDTLTFKVLVNIRSPKRIGTKAGAAEQLQDFTATVWRPEVFGPEGTPVVRSVKATQAVMFQFTNLVEV